MAPPLVVSLLVTAGSMVASYLMMPRITQTPTESGKLDDIRITGSEYGTYIPRIFGKARIGGNIIWSSGIKHQIFSYSSSGGKGVPSAPAERQHFYTTDVGVQFCRGPILEFERIWADVDLIADRVQTYRSLYEAEDAVLAGTAYIVDPDTSARNNKSVAGIGNQGSGTPGTVTFDLRTAATPDKPPSEDESEIREPISTYELYVKTDGTKEMILGFVYDLGTPPGVETSVSITPNDTDGEWQIFSIEAGGFPDELVLQNPTGPAPAVDAVKVHRRWYTGSNEAKYTAGITSGFKDPDLTYNEASLNAQGAFDYYPQTDVNGVINGTLTIGGIMRFYTGTSTQPQDNKHLQSLSQKYGNGSLWTPAYRDTVVMVLEGVQLNRGRLPNYTVELYNNYNDCNDILNQMCEDVGITSSQRDFSQTSAFSLIGYVENTKQSRRSHIENLERYFGFRIAEVDGKIISIVDDGEAEFVGPNTPPIINPDLLRSHSYGSQMPPSDFVVSIADPISVPKEIRFSIMNPLVEYQNETVGAAIEEGVSSNDAQDFTFPIVDSIEQAKRRAEFLLLKMHSEQQKISFDGMPELMKYTVGDLITLEIEGEYRVVRIEKKQAQMPLGIIKFEGVLTDNVYVGALATPSTELSPIGSDQLASIAFPRIGKAVPIISLPITDAERGKLGVYIGVGNAGVGTSLGTGLYREFGTDNFILQEFFDAPCVMGVTNGTLGTHATPATEDTVNTIDIDFYDAVSLESVTGADLDARPTLNLMRIGDEWVQFRTATLQTLPKQSVYGSRWRLSNLRRGRFGTTAAISTHGSGENAVMVTPSLYFLKLETADIGETVTLKAVAGGQTLDDVSPISFTFNPVSAYTVTNATDDRSFDADSTTIDELADVVATIIKDTNL